MFQEPPNIVIGDNNQEIRSYCLRVVTYIKLTSPFISYKLTRMGHGKQYDTIQHLIQSFSLKETFLLNPVVGLRPSSGKILSRQHDIRDRLSGYSFLVGGSFVVGCVDRPPLLPTLSQPVHRFRQALNDSPNRDTTFLRLQHIPGHNVVGRQQVNLVSAMFSDLSRWCCVD